MGGLMRMFSGRGRGRSRGGESQVSGANISGQSIRISADIRTNSVLVTANEDNITLVEEVILKLDGEIANAAKLKRYNLTYADANEVARVITDLFSTQSPQQRSTNRGRGRGFPFAFGGGGGGEQ